MEIYLVRHGQTDYNLRGIVQGRGVNSSLNETGQCQAQAFYDAYQHIKFDRLYISALRRTHETMQLFLDRGIQHHIRTSIDEINWGIYEGVAHDPVKHERYLDIIGRWRSGDYEIRIDGGESAADLCARLQPFVEELKGLSDSRILICSHGRTIRLLLCLLTDTPISKMDEFEHSNTSLYTLRYDGSSFVVLGANDSSHLNGKC